MTPFQQAAAIGGILAGDSLSKVKHFDDLDSALAFMASRGKSKGK
jgi:hypothetical protein